MKNTYQALNVLIIDDEPAMLEVAAYLINREDGVQVLLASSFDEADAILAQQNVQLIICDYHVSGKTPEYWLQGLRLKGLESLVLIYTGSYEVEGVGFPALSGVLRTILKTDIQGLRDSIQVAKRYWAYSA